MSFQAVLVAARAPWHAALVAALQTSGYRVTLAGNLDEARLAIGADCRMVLIDMETADLSAAVSAALPCRAPEVSHVLWVAMARITAPAHLMMLLDAGFDDILDPHANLETLQAQVRLLDRRFEAGQPCRSRNHARSPLGSCPLFEEIPFGVLRADAQGRVLHVNHVLVSMLGYESPEQLRSLNLTEDIYCNPQQRPTVLEAFGERFGGRSVQWRRRDGSRMHVRVWGRVVRNGNGEVAFFEEIVEDVTAHARAEQRFQAVFENAALGIAVTDRQGRFIECNQALSTMLGHSLDAILGRTFLDLTHPADRPRDAAVFQRLVSDPGHPPLQLEKRFLHASGQSVWARVTASVLPESGGHPLLTMALIENITQWKEAEDQLHESEDRYRLIAENVSDMIWTVTFDALPLDLIGNVTDCTTAAEQMLAEVRFQYVSPSVRTMLGYTVEEALALRVADLLSPASLERACQALAEVIARPRDSGPVQRTLELEHIHKNGSRRWCEVTSTMVHRPGRPGPEVLGISRDVTARREAERALRVSEGKLRGLFENLPDLVLIVDRQGLLEFSNRGLDDIVGSAASLQTLMEFIAEDDRARVWEILEQAFLDNQPHCVEIQDYHGSWWVMRFAPMFEEHELRRTMVICTDVTARHQAEEAIREEQRLLRQVLELHERDRQMISYEIHDALAQQLTGTLFHLQAYQQIRESGPNEADKLFQQALALLTSSINETRRLISGLRPPILDEFGIVAAIDYLISEERQRGGPAIVFHHVVTFARLAPPLEAALFRIVQEVLSNACRHSQSTLVRIELMQRDSTIQLQVRDWGTGFDPAAATTQGFGLRGVRERTRLLGGSMSVVSSAEEGTRVMVELPLVENVP